MTTKQEIELMGAPGSPYTRKMLALLRYRRIPHRILWGGRHDDLPGYPRPKVPLLPTFYFPTEEGGREAMVDSTFILRRLESEHAGRAVLPADPALAFLDYLIEDFADEWLTKAMFHYRWSYQADIENAAPLLVYWHDPKLTEADAAAFAEFFAKRQIDRLHVVGSNPVTAETIETSFKRLVPILSDLVAPQGYALGARPAACDFALYGQLTQLACVDPTPSALLNAASPRLRAWVDRVEDLSGLEPSEGDWASLQDAADRLAPLLAEIGRVYVPILQANADAVARGAPDFTTRVDGREWTQPVFPYQAKCLAWIREAFDALPGEAKAAVAAVLDAAGCEGLVHAE